MPAPLPIQSKSATRQIPERQQEVRRVVKRLRQVIQPYFEAARRLKVDLESEDIVAVLDALKAEAKHEAPDEYLDDACVESAYLRRAIFDECLLEPSTVLLHTPLGPGRDRYEAMPTDFWLACITEFRTQLINAKETP